MSRIDQLTVTMNDFVSRMYLFLPYHPRRRLMILHQGHTFDVADANGAGTIRFFLERRYPVLVVNMPLYGPNTGPWSPFFLFQIQ